MAAAPVVRALLRCVYVARAIHSVTCNSRIKNLMKEAPAAYSLVIMHRDVIYAVRDPYGNRPLCIGRLMPVSDINDKGNVSEGVSFS